jgi:glycosyltransferase involved in cell wall biosynthesis
LPEIVEHGRNGFLVSNAEEMAAAIGKAGSLNPEVCRSSASSRFSADQMIQRYFDAYAEIMERARNAVPDTASESSSLTACALPKV